MTHDAQATPSDIMREAMGRLHAPDRHNIRNALVSLRNGLDILGDHDGEKSVVLTEDERRAVWAELASAAQLLEKHILGIPTSD